MRHVTERNPGRHGTRALNTALKEFKPEDPRTRSELERRFLAVVRQAGLPEPQCNVYVDDLLVDPHRGRSPHVAPDPPPDRARDRRTA
ncbi:MAG: hypothetical protein ACRDNK_20410, partial [Solirubrobacteraceae bacterium]